MEGTELIISLLSDIKAQLSEGDGVSKMTIAIIAAGGALAGTLITSVFQFLNGKEAAKNERSKLDTQLKAELVSKQRQEWMDSVREKAADLLAEYDHVFGLLTDSDGQNQESPASDNQNIKAVKHLFLLKSSVAWPSHVLYSTVGNTWST